VASILSPSADPRSDPTEPSRALLRSRNLLALALLNHRASPDLDAEDVHAVRQVLLGEWDAV